MKPHISLLSLLLSLLLLTGCERDSYEKGEGRYSLMQADFVELSVNSSKQGVSFVNDEGSRYALTPLLTASWIQTADTVYRAILYYNKVEEGVAAVRSAALLPTMTAGRPEDFKRQPEDPLGLESSWLTPNAKYINLGLLLKNGRDEEDKEGTHALGLVCDETRVNADGTRTACYRLLHDQGKAPEYYTSRRYASILLPTDQRPDSVRLTITTYEGVVVKKFKI